MAFGDLLGTLSGSGASIPNPAVASGSVAVNVNDIIIAVLAEQTALTATGCTDDLGNTYTPQNAGNLSTTISGRMFYSIVTVAGTVTAVRVACTSSAHNYSISAAAFEGMAGLGVDASPANAVDDLISAYSSNSTGTLARLNEIAIGWAVSDATVADWTSANSTVAIQTIDAGALAHSLIAVSLRGNSTSFAAPGFSGTAPTHDVLGVMTLMVATPVLGDRINATATGILTGTSSAATNAVPTTATVTVGDVIIVVMAELTSSGVSGVTDNLGNVYIFQASGSNSGVFSNAYYSIATVGGSLTTINVACSTTAHTFAIAAAVFEGPFNAVDAKSGNVGGDVTAPYTAPATGVLETTPELVVAWSANSANSNWAAIFPNIGATNAPRTSVNALIGYQVVSSTASITPEFTGTAPSANNMGTISFYYGIQDTPLYNTPVSGTITLTGLATSATFVAGRQSAAIDNGPSGDDAIDAMVGGKVVTGASSTANTNIEVWAFGTYDGTSYSAGAGASDANLTVDVGAKPQMRRLTTIQNSVTTSATYVWGPYSVMQAFGGAMPQKWGIFIVHNTGVALASGGELKYVPIKQQAT